MEREGRAWQAASNAGHTASVLRQVSRLPDSAARGSTYFVSGKQRASVHLRDQLNFDLLK